MQVQQILNHVNIQGTWIKKKKKIQSRQSDEKDVS